MIALWAGGVCLLYFLRIGPVPKLMMGTRFEGVADGFYTPLLDRAPWPPVRCYLSLWDLYHPNAGRLHTSTEIQAMSRQQPNLLQATPGCALLFYVAQRPGAP
jgi:hypothetical protein